MSEKTYDCNEIALTHSQMVDLHKSGHLNLGMNNSLAAEISNEGIGARKSSAFMAFHLWNWVAVGGLGYSIYLSVTDNWWWFIVGLSGVSVVWRANKKSNSENLLQDAMDDKEFYDRVRKIGGWLYQIEETEAEKFLKGV